MANKFPIGQSFQRLNNEPLDSTTVFNTMAQAQEYAKNNPTAYRGQIIHVKDARTIEDLGNGVDIYGESCYIDSNKDVRPICSFTYSVLDVFFDVMHELLEGPTESTKEKVDYLHTLIMNGQDINQYPEGELDYKILPWDSSMYNDYQVSLKMTQPTEDKAISSNAYFSGDECTVENITITRNGAEEFYKIITFEGPPSAISFRDGYYIEKVIHMCDTSNLVRMDGMFANCSSAIDFNLHNLQTQNVMDMTNMFYNCKSIVELNCSNWNTNKLTNTQWMFASCNSLTKVNLNGWNMENVTNTSRMFGSCNSLQLSNINMFSCSAATQEKITNAFNGV